MNIEISVVICTYNGHERVSKAFDSILSNKIKPKELIVVDNNSDCFSAKQLHERVNLIKNVAEFPVHLHVESKQGLAYARSSGVECSSGNYVLFVDDDNEISFDFIDKLVQLIGSLNPDYIGCRTILPKDYPTVDGDLNEVFSAYAIGSLYPTDRWLNKSTPCVWGAGMCVKKESYVSAQRRFGSPLLIGRTGGKLMAGDDSEICYRLALMGFRGYYSNELLIIHHIKINRLKKEYAVGMYYGFGLSSLTLGSYARQLKYGNRLNPLFMSLLDLMQFFNYCRKIMALVLSCNRSFKNQCLREMCRGAIDRFTYNKWSSIYPKYNPKIFQ